MKRLLVLAVFTAGYFPFSCFPPPCDGDQLFSTITEMEVALGRFGPSGFELISSTDFTIATIQLRVVVATYESAEIILPRNLGLVSPTYACSPPPPEPTQALDAITIVATDSIFLGDTGLPPNSDITDFFAVLDEGRKFSVPAFVAAQNEDPWLFGQEMDHLLFQLRNAPNRPIRQPLIISCSFDDGTSFRLQTELFIIDV